VPFGLEVELWRIGSSPAAPKFNIVSKPNEWSHSVAQAARAIDDAELSDTRVMQREYWAALNLVLDAFDGPVSGGHASRKLNLGWPTVLADAVSTSARL